MAVRIDPSGEELSALLSCSGKLEGRRVLEVGCGDGRLTRQYAALADHVFAIDPDADRIAQAKSELPAELNARVTFAAYGLLDSTVSERFDLVILAWSL